MAKLNGKTIKVECKFAVLSSCDGTTMPDEFNAAFDSEARALEHVQTLLNNDDDFDIEYYIAKILKVVSRTRPSKPPITVKTVVRS